MEQMIMPLRRFADFSGRSTRQEFWLFFLFQVIINIAFFLFIIGMAAVMGDATQSNEAPPVFFMLLIGAWILWVLAMIVPNAAVIVRRCHDQDMSGWVGGLLYVSYFLITITGLPLIIIMCLEGTRGPNKYGADPLGRDGNVFK